MASACLPPRLLGGNWCTNCGLRVSAVEYKSHLIEAFEDQPGRWFAYFRRLDGQNIAGSESNRLRTSSARYSKDDAIEFAKEAIDALPDA